MSQKQVTSLQERLTPSHLIPETEEALREEIKEISSEAKKPEDATDPRDSVEYAFELNFEDGKGKVWKGRFVNKILSIRERQMVGVMRARLTGGAPYESMDPLTSEINLMVTHLTTSLKERPEWAKDLLTLTNYEILQAIYLEVDSHESKFHGRPTLEESSKG